MLNVKKFIIDLENYLKDEERINEYALDRTTIRLELGDLLKVDKLKFGDNPKSKTEVTQELKKQRGFKINSLKNSIEAKSKEIEALVENVALLKKKLLQHIDNAY